uniref:ATP-dependent RNA helicase n=1 Tax=Bionectria ochroleuca TaxID=29856 RepID=A0A8H7TTG7_BIOOC
MGPQLKKRKLHSTPTDRVTKRSKPSTAGSKSKRKAVDAAALAWEAVDTEEFGGLQVIEGVEVVKQGNKVQFLVSESQQNPEHREAKKYDEDESFEGFGDDPAEGRDLPKGKDGAREAGLEAERPGKDGKGDKQKQKQKQKQPKQSKQQLADAKLAPNSSKKSSAQGNAFQALADDDAQEEEGLDMAAWAALNLSPQMLSAIAKLKFAKPTLIQTKTIPGILAGEDVIGKAQTGSGKTLAFGIPIVERWLEEQEKRQDELDESDDDADEGESADDDEDDEDNDAAGRKKQTTPIALVLSPTRELAKQLGDHLKALCDGLSSAPYICVITGGLSIQKQQRQLAKADIVIGTPGRLWEVLEGDAKLQESFTKISFLVVDEADRLLKAGQFKEAEDILGALDRKDPEQDEESDDEEEDLSPRQTLVFSATFDKDLQTKLAGTGRRHKGDEDKMAYLMKRLNFRREAKFIDANPVRQMAEGLKEGLIECGAMDKDLYLYTVLLLNPKQRTVVFTNSISAVRRITPFLTNLAKARLRSLERFTAAAKASVLIATDVAARGLDIPEVDMVLHYHVPRAADTYVHRSGRTARGERSGVIPTRRLAAKVHAEASSKKEHLIQTLPIDRRIASRLKPRTTLAKTLADAALAKEKSNSDDSFMRNLGRGGRGGGRKRKEKAAREMSKAEMGALRAQLKHELTQRVNLGVSERYITGGRVDVAALLKEREKGTQLGVFLGGDAAGLGFDL